MCQPKHNIIFCTCQNKKYDYKKEKVLHEYIWTLSKYIGRKQTLLKGKIAIPQKDLDNGITADNILTQLNSTFNSFDFEYNPSQGDCLNIRVAQSAKSSQYLSVIYKDGKWKEGLHNVFTSITENIAEGKIKISYG